MTPKVFISHASEDKSRFVNAFATKLRENGVDAWLDRWEMVPGDSLVDKIFEEGLKDAQAVIVVLSKFSVAKPWVSEELNASVVSRISKGTKIIPVVIDDCDVPESLKSTLWERVDDLASFEVSLRRIIAGIFDAREKPAVGQPPEFVREAVNQISGLTTVDSLVLRRAVQLDLKNNIHVIRPDGLFSDHASLGLTKQQVSDSIDILEADGYFKVTRYIGGDENSFACHFEVTDFGFEKYCNAELKNYSELKEVSAGLIVNENIRDNKELARRTGSELRLIEHILAVFESNQLIRTLKFLDGGISIEEVHAKFRRMLER